MALVLMEVHLRDNNGMPNDDCINTFVFGTSDGAETPAGLANAVKPHLDTFYVTPSVEFPTRAIADFLANSIQLPGLINPVVGYALADAGSVIPRLPLGGPVFTSFLAAQAGGRMVASDLPREAAAVLTVNAPHAGIAEDVPGGAVGPKGDTHPAARKRGRLYLGSLNTGALGAGTNGPGLSIGFRQAAAAAAKRLMIDVATELAGTVFWGIWSRVGHTVDPITYGWMDDAFDTQRRRGIGSTARLSFSSSGIV